MPLCSICSKTISRGTKTGLCQSCFRSSENKKKIDHWQATGETGCQVATTLRSCIRDYILEKQHNCCSICGLSNVWNGKTLKFVLDHIDGDASNNWELNLRLVCPNCDSQLDTFKSKNKNSARSFRNKKNC